MRTLFVVGVLCALAGPVHAQPCCGDINGDDSVAINELVTAVGYALDGCPAAGPCAGDCDGSGVVTVNELVTAVGYALSGCPGADTPTPARSPTRTPIPTKTPIPSKTPVPTKTETPTRAPTAVTSCPLNFLNAADSSIGCIYAGILTSPTCPGLNTPMGAGWASDNVKTTAVFIDPDNNEMDVYGVANSAKVASIDLLLSGLQLDFTANGTLGLPTGKQFTMRLNTFLSPCSPLTFTGTFNSLADLSSGNPAAMERSMREAMGR